MSSWEWQTNTHTNAKYVLYWKFSHPIKEIACAKYLEVMYHRQINAFTYRNLHHWPSPDCYKGMVRSVLDTRMGSNYIKDCDVMERVQRRATKCVQDLSSLYYDERLVTLKLCTLSYRRHRADMIMVFNILNRNVNLQPELFFHLNLSSITRGHAFKLLKPHAQKNIHSKFFSMRTNNSWNNLPNQVASSRQF